MKPFLEKIQHQKKTSFEILHTPNLNKTFYWHYHPEIEIVYSKSPQGIRHVGSHISTYTQSDLVLIGSNIPHLNFDYGVDNKVETVVIHLPSNFFEQKLLQASEFNLLQSLLSKANQAVAFSGKTKEKVGQLLESITNLSDYHRSQTFNRETRVVDPFSHK